jgi:homopolymeric O-antigen transport system permease protein
LTGTAFVDFNLLYHYVDIIRAPLLGRAPQPWSWAMATLALVFGWAGTVVFYSRFRQRVAYWL